MKWLNTLKPAFFGAGFLFFLGCSTFGPSSTDKAIQHFVSGETQFHGQLTKACEKKKTLACALLGQEVQVQPELSILQGYTDSQSTQLNVLVSRSRDVSYWLVEEVDPFRGRALNVLSSVEQKFSAWRVDRLHIDGLKLGVNYQLWVSEKGRLIDRRRFMALDLGMKSPQIVVASCLDDGYLTEQKVAWEQVAQISPQMIFLIGDNVYADKYLKAALKGKADPEGLWRRHVETRQRLDLYRWEKLIPILAIWDDHDYGFNNGGESYSHREFSQAVFRAFFAQSPSDQSALRSGPGVAFSFSGFNLDWYFLDGRSFRSPNHPDLKASTHLGVAQKNWLFSELQRGPQNKLGVLIKGDQFFGGYHKFESFEGSHPVEFDEFKDKMKRIIRPLLLISGDRHLIELLRVSRGDMGQDTYEFTTSAIHAKTFPDEAKDAPPRVIERRAGVPNFGVIKPYHSRGLWQMLLEGRSYDGTLLFSRELTFKGRHR